MAWHGVAWHGVAGADGRRAADGAAALQRSDDLNVRMNTAFLTHRRFLSALFSQRTGLPMEHRSSSASACAHAHGVAVRLSAPTTGNRERCAARASLPSRHGRSRCPSALRPRGGAAHSIRYQCASPLLQRIGTGCTDAECSGATAMHGLTRARTRTRRQPPTHTHAQAHTLTHTRRHPPTHAGTHAGTHTHTHARTHSRAAAAAADYRCPPAPWQSSRSRGSQALRQSPASR
jgi:hypothetical protein